MVEVPRLKDDSERISGVLLSSPKEGRKVTRQIIEYLHIEEWPSIIFSSPQRYTFWSLKPVRTNSESVDWEELPLPAHIHMVACNVCACTGTHILAPWGGSPHHWLNPCALEACTGSADSHNPIHTRTYAYREHVQTLQVCVYPHTNTLTTLKHACECIYIKCLLTTFLLKVNRTLTVCTYVLTHKCTHHT